MVEQNLVELSQKHQPSGKKTLYMLKCVWFGLQIGKLHFLAKVGKDRKVEL